ncbi:MAG TPA: NAD(P)H-dependent glycerol-3-phosphate dehydrogenase, partial [Acidobacteriaceae bacterium]|nr:NAD(P)H-dependent glycerol-3-phosphate dehydrogenase [Acidobacteriaceae bacterium]
YKQQEITLWSHNAANAAALNKTRRNDAYLPGFELPANIHITADLKEASAADILLCVVPSRHMRGTIEALRPLLRPEHILLSATKGIEEHTYLRMSEVMQQAAGHKLHIGVLSGPSFAQEVAAQMPTAITIASSDAQLAQNIQKQFSSSTLRLYTNDDVTGVELGGALKNVIALSAGIVAGLGLGANATAALITRGISEITRLAIACGGKKHTLAGLSGVGDLVLTCTGSLSRNRTVGIELGRGRKLPEILEGLHGKVAEGVGSTTAALGLARKHGVEMPITEQMEAILHHGKSPKDAIRDLMSRPGRDE